MTYDNHSYESRKNLEQNRDEFFNAAVSIEIQEAAGKFPRHYTLTIGSERLSIANKAQFYRIKNRYHLYYEESYSYNSGSQNIKVTTYKSRENAPTSACNKHAAVGYYYGLIPAI